MPGGDGMGPGGMGPMTGRAMGYCAGYPVPGFANPGAGFGMGFGRGRGGGRGRRNRFYATGLTGWQRAATGWGPYAGPATGYAGPAPGYAGPVPAAIPAVQELEALKNQAEYFQGAVDEVKKRIDELEGAQEK